MRLLKGNSPSKFIATGCLYITVSLSGCAIKQSKDVTVYQSRGAVQCETTGSTVQESRDKLMSIGVSVESSQCARLNDLMFASVCGGKTADILVHSVNARDLKVVQEMGFTLVSELESAESEAGYTIVPCE
ncbi:hypothetical protein [Enterovibrio sp. FF113]|uniref:hypothetical protein n=1 Tax=Enterovibrio sp. FF113 TaxID=3230010 RepID=UPI00352DBF0B